MLLATTQIEDFDRFLEVFSTAGAEKRKQHGSKGALVFRDPSEDDRVWVVFDWDEQGWQSFVSDPEVPPILKRAGTRASRRPGVRRPVRGLTHPASAGGAFAPPAKRVAQKKLAASTMCSSFRAGGAVCGPGGARSRMTARSTAGPRRPRVPSPRLVRGFS